jgi:glyoxylase-like metal-dependent hydrolase (beta-lactamase superfamily II)
MAVLTTGVRYIDLHFQQAPRVIATALLDAPGGVALVDPGPSSCLPALGSGLEALGVRLSDVTTLLLTHIHLDHAGATGTLVRDHPRIRVLVHERGARHLIDPARLIDSARRLYGDRMDVLWGEFLPVPSGNVEALAGGERIEAGGRRFEVAYTPGHASHHVSYFDAASGLAFVGDTCGARIGGASFVMPPTPPPDIDLELWHQSLDRILRWSPSTLFLTHFGPSEHPGTHIESLRARLGWTARRVREALDRHPHPSEEALAAQLFEREVRQEMRRHMTEADARSYESAVPLDHCFLGLARYWRKRSAPVTN